MSAIVLAPGIHELTNAQHHELRALSNSGMKDLAVSPLRYWYRKINPAPKPEEEETAALRMGSALHCAVLEPEEVFESRYACALDPGDWPVCLDTISEITGWIKDKGEKLISKNAAGEPAKKADWISQAQDLMKRLGVEVPILEVEKARFFAKTKGKTILHSDEIRRVAGMTIALLEEPVLKPILSHGKSEVSMVAKDPETGVLLKARLDWMAPRHTLDLKTFTVKRGGSIDKAIHDAIWYEEYHVQMYFYDLVRRLVTGESHDRIDSVIAFVESDQPHETRIKQLLPKRGGSVNLFWETARQKVRMMIRTYAHFLNRFGDEPWRDKQEISTLADEDIKQLAWS